MISQRERWLICIGLYWAGGSKEKDYRPGSMLQFANFDPYMIKSFVDWLEEYGIHKDRIGFDIYIHKNSFHTIGTVKRFWSEVTGYSIEKFQTVYYKRHKIKTNRTNTKDLYYGRLRVKVRTSSDLVRLFSGWARAIVKSK